MRNKQFDYTITPYLPLAISRYICQEKFLIFKESTHFHRETNQGGKSVYGAKCVRVAFQFRETSVLNDSSSFSSFEGPRGCKAVCLALSRSKRLPFWLGPSCASSSSASFHEELASCVFNETNRRRRTKRQMAVGWPKREAGKSYGKTVNEKKLT